MDSVGFIFARGGSKGLPGKNTLPIAGKPLIAWSIECALKVSRIKRLIVSTDSPEIAKIAVQYGAEAPFIRPSRLATDDSAEWDSWKHGLNYIRESTGTLPKIMVSIPPVAPLRAPIDIENCLTEYDKGLSDIVISVTESRRSPYFNMVKTLPDGSYGLVSSPDSLIYRRQDVPLVYDITTVCYVANSEYVLSHESMFEGQVGAVQVPTERSIDIDTALDFKVAEFLLKVIKRSQR
jgi:N-acylneuraminate cytidylyltransferase